MQKNNITLKLRKSICFTLLAVLGLSLSACSNQSKNNTLESSIEEVVEKETNTAPKGIFDDLNIGTFQVSSEDLQEGIWNSIITNTQNGSNVSPQLTWDAVPGAANQVHRLDGRPAKGCIEVHHFGQVIQPISKLLIE